MRLSVMNPDIDPIYKKFIQACENDDVPLFKEYMRDVDKWGHILIHLQKPMFNMWHNYRAINISIYSLPHVNKIKQILSDALSLGCVEICKYIVYTYGQSILLQSQARDYNDFSRHCILHIPKTANGLRIITEIFPTISAEQAKRLFKCACECGNQLIVEFLLSQFEQRQLYNDSIDVIKTCIYHNHAQLTIYFIEKFKLHVNTINRDIKIYALQHSNPQLVKYLIKLDKAEHIHAWIEFAWHEFAYLNVNVLFEYAKEHDLLDRINWQALANISARESYHYNDVANTFKIIIKYGPYQSDLTLITDELLYNVFRSCDISIIKHIITNKPVNNITSDLLMSSIYNENIEVFIYVKSLYTASLDGIELKHDIAKALISSYHHKYLMEHKEYITNGNLILIYTRNIHNVDQIIKWILDTFPISVDQYYDILHTYLVDKEYDYACIILENVGHQFTQKQIHNAMQIYRSAIAPLRLTYAFLSITAQPDIEVCKRCATQAIVHNDINLLMRMIPHAHKYIIPLMRDAYHENRFECLNAMHQFILNNP